MTQPHATTKSMLSNVTPAVLANVGVPVSLYRTKVVSTEHIADDELVEYQLRFTNWTISQLEDQFTSLQRWDSSMNDQPFRTVIRTLALMLEWPPQRVAAAMPMGHVVEYQLAIHAALQMAMGADPKKIAKALNETLGGQTGDTPPTATSTFSTKMDDSPGSDSGAPGQGMDATQMSSGDAPQHRSEPSSSPWPS